MSDETARIEEGEPEAPESTNVSPMSTSRNMAALQQLLSLSAFMNARFDQGNRSMEVLNTPRDTGTVAHSTLGSSDLSEQVEGGDAPVTAENNLQGLERQFQELFPNTAEAGAVANPQSQESNEMAEVVHLAEQFLPMFILLLLVFFVRHYYGITQLCWFLLLGHHTSQRTNHQIALRENRERWVLIGCMVCLAAQLVLTYGLGGWYLLQYLVFAVPAESIAFSDALWILVANDVMLRFVGGIFKCMAIAFLPNSMAHRRKLQTYHLIEATVMLYRMTAPIGVWWQYFTYDEDLGKGYSSFFTSLYLFFKFLGMSQRLKMYSRLLQTYVKVELMFGRYATEAEIVENGDNCAICQESMVRPVALPCDHIFCEDCVGEWFEREPTCPLCRSVVTMHRGIKLPRINLPILF